MAFCIWWAAGSECSSMLFPVKTITAFQSGYKNVTQFMNLIGYGIDVLSFILETLHSRFLQRPVTPTKDS